MALALGMDEEGWGGEWGGSGKIMPSLAVDEAVRLGEGHGNNCPYAVHRCATMCHDGDAEQGNCILGGDLSVGTRTPSCARG